MDNEEKKKLKNLYSKMGDDLINQFKLSGINPNDAALDAGISSDRILELLFDTEKGDYLAYREMDASIKRLSKSKHNENELRK